MSLSIFALLDEVCNAAGLVKLPQHPLNYRVFPDIDNVAQRVLLIVQIFPEGQIEGLMLSRLILTIKQPAYCVDPVVRLDLHKNVVAIYRALLHFFAKSVKLIFELTL